MQLNVGTHEVERSARGACRQNVRKERNTRLIRNMMQYKVEDARYDERCTRHEFVRCKIEYSIGQQGGVPLWIWNSIG